MSSSSQTPRPMPKPRGLSREQVKARVYAKIEAERALPASEQIANMLHAVRTTAEAQELINRFREEVRHEIAADFQQYGKSHDTLSWGQAFYIARDGLNGGTR